MARSVWKGPFVDGYLLKKAEAARASGRNEVIKIWSRRSTILPQFVGLTFGVHNGHKHIPVLVSRGNGRPQVRRVRADPDLPWPSPATRKPRRKLSHEQESTPARAGRERGQGRHPHAARQPAEAERRGLARSAARRSTRRSPISPSRAAASPRTSRRRWSRRSPTPRTTTTSTSTTWSSPRPRSARTW